MSGPLPILPLPAPPSDGNLGPLPESQVTGNSQPNGITPALSTTPAPATAVDTHTRTIGIIYPPAHIRSIADKTAQFVAKHGAELERKILLETAKNAKLSFLKPSDAYHAYYKHRLSESRNQIQHTIPSELGATDASPSGNEKDNISVSIEHDPSAQSAAAGKISEPPEAEQYTVRLPEGITSEELDIIKITAQFVARNGKDFLRGLTSRESNNTLFDFLRPSHSKFMLFTALADAYSKVLMPPKGLTDELARSVADMSSVLQRCLNRLEWERSQEQARQKAENEIEEERMQMAMIDWHDFVVVETIEITYDEEEELPVPMTLDEVVRRSKISAFEQDLLGAHENGIVAEMEMEMEEEEMQLVQEGTCDKKVAIALEESEPPMRIVKNWKRPEERVPSEKIPTKFVVSPITGELIPINEMAEHMRISLIDPKFKEQKERMMAKFRETTLARDDEISRNLEGLARTRPDVFGTTEEEVSNAVKAEIDKKKDEQPKQVSSGITAIVDQQMGPILGMPSTHPPAPPPVLPVNMPSMIPYTMHYPALNNGYPVAPPLKPPMVLNASVVPPPPPTQLITGQKPLMVSPPPLPSSMSMSGPLGGSGSFVSMPIAPPHFMNIIPPPPLLQGIPPPPPPPEEAFPPLPEEPEPKRQKFNESVLLPEDKFLAQHPGPIRITVSVLNEGNLKGQLLQITVQSISESICSLKEKIAGEVQLPANKQKLIGRAGVLKDNMSLAYYNVTAGDTITLALKERGGRKR